MSALVRNDPGKKPNASTTVVAQQADIKSAARPNRRLKGLLVRKECWRLSLVGKVLVLLVVLSLGYFVMRTIHPFLAITQRASGEYLVVEGWVPADGLQTALGEFKKGGYVKILTTGTVARSEWSPNTKSTYADWAASKFSRLGASNDVVEAVPCWVEKKDRTYYSALALKNWFRQKGRGVRSIDVVTKGPHARRTRLLFQKALGNEVRVGVISIEDKDYDPKHWWRSSEGVRDVVGEAIAYLYARVFFHPGTEESMASGNP